MSKTYFINNADSYLGKSLLSKIAGPESEEQEPEPRVMCTKLDANDVSKPRGVKKVLKVKQLNQRGSPSPCVSSTT